MAMIREMKHRRLAEALRQTGGNMAAAGRLLGLTRQSVYEMVSKSPELQQVCREVLEETNDEMEAKLRELAIQKGNVVAVLATLNAKARDRGYARHTTEVAHSGTVDHYHTVYTQKSGNELLQHLSDEELRLRIAQRRAALAAQGQTPVQHPLLEHAPVESEMVDVTPERGEKLGSD